jgi:hypothetical protein
MGEAGLLFAQLNEKLTRLQFSVDASVDPPAEAMTRSKLTAPFVTARRDNLK